MSKKWNDEIPKHNTEEFLKLLPSNIQINGNVVEILLSPVVKNYRNIHFFVLKTTIDKRRCI